MSKGVTQRSVWGIPTSPSPLWTRMPQTKEDYFSNEPLYSAPQSLHAALSLSTNRFTSPKLTDWLWRILNQPCRNWDTSWILSWGGEWGKGKARTTRHCDESCADDRRCIAHAVHTSDLRGSSQNPNLRFADPEPERCIAGSSARRTMGSALLHLKKRSTSSATQRSWKSWLKDISQIWSNY